MRTQRGLRAAGLGRGARAGLPQVLFPGTVLDTSTYSACPSLGASAPKAQQGHQSCQGASRRLALSGCRVTGPGARALLGPGSFLTQGGGRGAALRGTHASALPGRDVEKEKMVWGVGVVGLQG